ncbi:MAG: MBL fold metallo-hydrolase [Planctomycetota bacterium]|jgi:hypothetical protein
MSFEVKFINHACFQIIKKDFSILVDPWFSGKVFNDSWELLRETNIDDLDLSNLKYIFISHEHPDHLSWSTLKKIREKCNQKIEVLMPKRDNTNIHENMSNLGFEYYQFEPYQFYKNGTDHFTFSFFKNHHDSAMLFDIDGKIILNKNDCEFSSEDLHKMKTVIFDNMLGRDIDLLFNQFSLAGFYANKNDKQTLKSAMESHISDLLNTHRILKPKTTVPFASFITFCRSENFFLNDHIVNIQEIVEDNKNINLFAPFYLENIPLEIDKKKSLANCKKWTKIFNEATSKEPKKAPAYTTHQLEKSFDLMYKEISKLKNYFGLNVPDTTFTLDVQDIDQYCEFNFSNNEISFPHTDDLSKVPIASVSSYDLDGFFKNPWGADTMNITSCFSVYNMEQWRKMLSFRDMCYVR